MEGIPEGAIASIALPTMPDGTPAVGAWNEPAMVQLENFFRLGYNRPLIEMVDAPEVSSPMQVSRDRVWQTIRGFLESLNIKVCVPGSGRDQGIDTYQSIGNPSRYSATQKRGDYLFGKGKGIQGMRL
jgi:hypothetical protein